jgi:GNAT superfamily N-acetyltransferase
MASPAGTVVVRLFEPADQAAARRLILDGLGQHFGFIDESLNPDLDDIAHSFADGVFVVACVGDVIAGTGGLLHESAGVAQIARMSTALEYRRRGVGRAVVARLFDEARGRGCARVTLATRADWDDAVRFYGACGFSEIGRTAQGIAFGLTL